MPGCGMYAQQLPAQYLQHHWLADAQTLYDRGHYAAAQTKVRNYMATEQAAPQLQQAKDPLLWAQARYMDAMCSFQLLHNDAEQLLVAVAQDYPHLPLAGSAYFHAGKLLFLKRYYNKVPVYLRLAQPEQLTMAEKQEAAFMLGFSYLQVDSLQMATSYLTPLTQELGPWHDQANYYLGIALYKQAQYAEAFKLFQNIEQGKAYQTKVPLYIASCLVALQQYVLAEDYANKLKQMNLEWEQKDLLYMQLGLAIFENKHYNEAVPYLEYYRDNTTEKPDRAALYRLGYAYYRSQQYTLAGNELKKVLRAEDTLTQAACLYLGFCQLELEQKEEALLSFQRAYNLDQEPAFTADALFHYAKLNFALKYFEAAYRHLDLFLTRYPTHANAREAEELLAEVLYYNGKLTDAIRYFEKKPSQNLRAQQAYQKVCYYYGVELLATSKEEAAVYFQKAIKSNAEPSYTQSARFWLAETQFYRKKYDQALITYSAYINEKGADQLAYYPQALLGKGWCLLRLTRYKEGANTFAQLQKLPELETEQPIVYFEALTRRADCIFMQKQYKDANFLYAKATTLPQGRVDYALFQNGICQSRLKEHDQAIAKLTELVDRHPNSPLRAEALYAISNEYLKWKNDFGKTISTAQRILNEHPGSPFAALAHINMGLAKNNQHKEEEATEHFSTVLRQYGNEEEPVKVALAELKQLMPRKTMDSLVADYRKNYPGSKPFLDEVSFAAARDLLLIENNYLEAIGKFSEFIREYPNSVNLSEALLLRGEAYRYADSSTLALADFEALMARTDVPRELQQRAQMQAAELSYDNKQYGRSQELYGMVEKLADNEIDRLQARMGRARTLLALADTAGAKSIYDQVYHAVGAPAFTKAKAGLELGKILLAQGQPAEAEKAFGVVAQQKNSATSAEAVYLLTGCLMQRKAYQQVVDTVFALKDIMQGHDQWRARTYLLMANAYWQLEKRRQAIETLRSIAMNATDPALQKEAEGKAKTLQAELDKLIKDKQAQDAAAAEKARQEKLAKERQNPVEEVDPKDPRLLDTDDEK